MQNAPAYLFLNVTWNDLFTMAAILLSPVIAWGVTILYQKRVERTSAKRAILGTIASSRHLIVNTDDVVRALNMIDFVFADTPEVRRLWHEYHEMLNNAGFNNAIGWPLQRQKKTDLVIAMMAACGYGKVVQADVDRLYYPQGLADQEARMKALNDALLEALQKGFKVLPPDN